MINKNNDSIEELSENNLNQKTNLEKHSSLVISDKKECRYCLSDDKNRNLINPCLCEGTMKYVHQECLEEWIKNGNKSISEINSDSNKKLFSTCCEICKFEIKYTKHYKNNLLKSIYKMLKNIFGSLKNVCNLIIHFVIVFFLIKRLKMLLKEFSSIFKKFILVNFLQPSFWINFIHYFSVFTSIFIALNDLCSFYSKMLITKRKCIVYFLPKIEQESVNKNLSI